MSDPGALESLDVFERFVLLAVADLTRDGESSIISYDVMERCRERADYIGEVSGGVERRNVIGALTHLTEVGLLSEDRKDTNPTGKGRPAYTLETDVDTLVDQLSDDDRVADYAALLA